MAQKYIDITTLSGWSSLSSGNHTITLKAKAVGYEDSQESQGVSVIKPASGETWIINESLSNAAFPDTGSTLNYYIINFTSNGISFKKFGLAGEYTRSRLMSGFIGYRVSDDSSSVIVYNKETIGTETWTDQAYRTVAFETAPTGDLLTWLQTYAVKQ